MTKYRIVKSWQSTCSEQDGFWHYQAQYNHPENFFGLFSKNKWYDIIACNYEHDKESAINAIERHKEHMINIGKTEYIPVQ